MVFYRKYRPQKIDDLDNAALRETLTALLQKETAHAFLFTGPKGLGKTSTARIIAKAVNCTARGDGSTEPCNLCDQCLTITEGTNMDVLEIDAASNRGIDEIRDLKEKIRLAPLSAKKKVYIIDEVHMLTTEAFNALLKTLEEPPSHALFMLCTTEPHKVPATILSRCFHVSFQPAGQDELVRSFKRIATGEGLTISDEVLATVAELAEGGFRDGAKILEELVSLASGHEITKAFIEEKYHVSSIKSYVTSLFAALQKKNAKEALVVISSLVEQGVDSKYFLTQLMEELHRMLLMHAGVKEPSNQVLLSLSEIQRLFALLSKASAEMKFAILPQLPLELAVIEYCSLEAQVIEKKQEPVKSKDEPVIVVEETVEVTVDGLRKQVGDMNKQRALYGEKKEPVVKREDAVADVDLLHTMPEGDVTNEWLTALWKALLSEIKNHNHTIAGVLRGCKIKHFDRKELILETAYKFHKERLDEPKTRDALHEICKKLTGKDVSVTIELKQ